MATIYDVAKQAGVSPKTVSRVLNGDGPVGKATRSLVEAAIADLGYVRSSAARTMRSNRSGLIGLVTGAISRSPVEVGGQGLSDLNIVQGVQRALAGSGRTLLIADTGGDPDNVPGLMRTFAEHQVEGLLYIAAHLQEVELPAMPGIPHIVIANGYDAAGTPAVMPDDREGQRVLTEAIIGQGHRRIAYLTLPENVDATGLRTAGYRDAIEAAGLPFDPDLVVAGEIGGLSQEEEAKVLSAAIDKVLALGDPPTVLCLGNDQMAIRVYGMLRSRGLRIPEDISIAGYDNDRMIAEILFPPLTTVELPYHAIGARAAETILGLIGGEGPTPSATRVSGPVCWRGSVAAAPQNLTDVSKFGRNT